MRFNFLILAAVLPTILLVAGAPVTNVSTLIWPCRDVSDSSFQEVELIARGAGKTATKASTPAKGSASTTTTKKTSCPAKSSKKQPVVSKLQF